MTERDPIRVLIVDDHEIVRTGLVALLDIEEDLDVVDSVADARAALRSVAATPVDVLVVDYMLPGMNGVELCRELAEFRAACSVVMLSAYLDDEVAWAAFAAGAHGFVLKDVDAEYLKSAIRHAARRKHYLDPKLASGLVGRFVRSAIRPSQGLLSPAVTRVLKLAIDGLTNKEIALELGVSIHTVKDQLAVAYRKLGVRDRAAAAGAAVKAGIY